MKKVRLEDLIDSISVTHKFNKEYLIFLNTSDVLNGKILTSEYSNIKSLKGQAKKTIKYKDILFSEIRPKNRRFAFVNIENTEDYVVSTKLMVLRNKSEEVLIEYVYYFLTYEGTLDYLQMRAENRIGSFPQITFDILKPISLNLPNLETQQKIIKILSDIDNKIELLHQINDNLAELAKTIYDYWFVQFDFPDKNGKPYKTSGGKMVYNNVLKREIPEGWEVKKLGEIAELYQPKTISEKEMLTNGKYLVYGANGIVGRYDQYNHTEPMVTITCRGNTCGNINFTEPFSWITGNAMVVKSKNNYSIDYLYNLLSISNIKKVISGSAQPQITRTNLETLLCIAPNDRVIKLYDSYTNKYFEQRLNNLKQIQHLQSLRDWLLPMLMNGQISVE